MVCDAECQKRKQLKTLSSAMATAVQNKEKDPEAYEQARTAYYTVKEGEGWAHQDKERQANEKIQPILDSYQQKFDKLKHDIDYQAMKAQAKQDVINSQVGDEDEVRFIHSEVAKERQQASVYQRMKELSGIPPDIFAWLPSFLDFILGIMILYLVYQIFVQGKLTGLKNYFTQSPS